MVGNLSILFRKMIMVLIGHGLAQMDTDKEILRSASGRFMAWIFSPIFKQLG